jgi:uncharacterized spore protein YtfJ
METKRASDVSAGGLVAVEALVKNLTRALEDEGNVKTVFGSPLKLDGHTVIPVASVMLYAGGGGGIGGSSVMGRALRGVGEVARRISPGSFGGGGGGGLDLRVRPVGFIHDGDNGVVFTPIHLESQSAPR